MEFSWVFILAVAFVTVHSKPPLDSELEEWTLYKKKFNKNYKTESEDHHRMNIFLDRKHEITAHNIKYREGHITYSKEINRFSDWTAEEWNRMLGYKYVEIKPPKNNSEILERIQHNVLPTFVNWTAKGAVTPVKDQGGCGSCWAFSATGSMEGQLFMTTGTLVSLSEQNLIDCSSKEHNHGCKGGGMQQAFQYVIDNKGIDTEASYPYEAKDDKCRFNRSNIGTTLSSFHALERHNEEFLKGAVATLGPISVGIYASGNLMHYKGGVFVDDACLSHHYLNHGVLLVGYGVDPKTREEYWLVKNSWGHHWGEHGYVRLARNRHNMCGISTSPSIPVI